MWWVIATAISVFAVCGAAAQTPPIGSAPEAVLVEGVRSLSGVWKISVPESVGVNFFGSVKFGPTRDMFCRIEQEGTDINMRCLNGGPFRIGSGTVQGENLHLAWGTAMARLVVDGTTEGDAEINGAFTVKFSGVRFDAVAPATATKLSLLVTTPDTTEQANMLAMILKELAEGSLSVPHDAAAITRNGGSVENFETARALGAIRAIDYLGQTDRFGPYLGQAQKISPRPAPIPFSVYAVEFAAGERICALHQRDDGVLDGFKCI